MTKKYITYSKTGTNWRLNLYAVNFLFTTDQPFGHLEVESEWVYTPGGSPKNN